MSVCEFIRLSIGVSERVCVYMYILCVSVCENVCVCGYKCVSVCVFV